MAYTWKSRRLAYDNIANGSATGVEFHNAGASYGEKTSRESIETRAVSADALNSSNIAGAHLELPLDNNTSAKDVVWNGAAQTSPTSDTSPGYTSGTSWTTVFPERL